MIHAYNEQYFPIIQEKLAEMFELAVLEENQLIDNFAAMFVSSKVCYALEKADPVYVLGKSANELLALVINNEPLDIETSDYASPEYWVGWVLAYAQWNLNVLYKTLISVYPCSKLIENYFPYHEMDISKSLELFTSRLPQIYPLKKFRQQKKWSQSDLSLLSGVPVRTIKSYEQGTADISRAQADTLYALSQALGCTIEDLIKNQN